jgi:hypothetical protein
MRDLLVGELEYVYGAGANWCKPKPPVCRPTPKKCIKSSKGDHSHHGRSRSRGESDDHKRRRHGRKHSCRKHGGGGKHHGGGKYGVPA